LSKTPGLVVRRRRVVVVLAVAVSALVPGLHASHAAAEPVLDANCPGPMDGVLALSGGSRAETFTAQTTGGLVRAELAIREAAMTSGNYVVQILGTDGSGVPTNTVLASATIPDASVPAGDSTLVGAFDPAAGVVAGQKYALSVSRSGSPYVLPVTNAAPCPGQLFFSGFPSTTWNPDPPNLDMIFAVFVESPSQPAEPQPLAGRNVTLDADKNKVKKGKRVTLSGRLTPARQGPCESSQTVELQRKKPSQESFATFAQVQTDAQGAFSLKQKVKKTFEFRAQLPQTTICAAAGSNTEKVKVKKRT